MFKTKITAIALAAVLTVSAISLTSCMKNSEEESSNATANGSGTSGGIGETVSEIVSDIGDGITGTEEVSKEHAENGHVTDTAESETAENESGSRRNMTATPYQGK